MQPPAPGTQPSLPGLEPAAPEGLVYRPGFLSDDEHRALVRWLRRLEYGDFRMHGVVARRRVVDYGFDYGADRREVTRSEVAIPDVLVPLRDRCAALAGKAPERLEQGLVAMYPPGAGVGWHRDAPQFGTVIGVSAGSGCRMRFRRPRDAATPRAAGWETWDAWLEPGSAYVLAGPARTAWQHAIPPVKALRWSITFRTLRAARARAGASRAR
jgi:alkylated DNA repair dioxygenase AlkB